MGFVECWENIVPCKEHGTEKDRQSWAECQLGTRLNTAFLSTHNQDWAQCSDMGDVQYDGVVTLHFTLYYKPVQVMLWLVESYSSQPKEELVHKTSLLFLCNREPLII